MNSNQDNRAMSKKWSDFVQKSRPSLGNNSDAQANY